MQHAKHVLRVPPKHPWRGGQARKPATPPLRLPPLRVGKESHDVGALPATYYRRAAPG